MGRVKTSREWGLQFPLGRSCLASKGFAQKGTLPAGPDFAISFCRKLKRDQVALISDTARGSLVQQFFIRKTV